MIGKTNGISSKDSSIVLNFNGAPTSSGKITEYTLVTNPTLNTYYVHKGDLYLFGGSEINTLIDSRIKFNLNTSSYLGTRFSSSVAYYQFQNESINDIYTKFVISGTNADTILNSIQSTVSKIIDMPNGDYEVPFITYRDSEFGVNSIKQYVNGTSGEQLKLRFSVENGNVTNLSCNATEIYLNKQSYTTLWYDIVYLGLVKLS